MLDNQPGNGKNSTCCGESVKSPTPKNVPQQVALFGDPVKPLERRENLGEEGHLGGRSQGYSLAPSPLMCAPDC